MYKKRHIHTFEAKHIIQEVSDTYEA